jgi:hypothetical protein
MPGLRPHAPTPTPDGITGRTSAQGIARGLLAPTAQFCPFCGHEEVAGSLEMRQCPVCERRPQLLTSRESMGKAWYVRPDGGAYWSLCFGDTLIEALEVFCGEHFPLGSRKVPIRVARPPDSRETAYALTCEIAYAISLERSAPGAGAERSAP